MRGLHRQYELLIDLVTGWAIYCEFHVLCIEAGCPEFVYVIIIHKNVLKRDGLY